MENDGMCVSKRAVAAGVPYCRCGWLTPLRRGLCESCRRRTTLRGIDQRQRRRILRIRSRYLRADVCAAASAGAQRRRRQRLRAFVAILGAHTRALAHRRRCGGDGGTRRLSPKHCVLGSTRAATVDERNGDVHGAQAAVWKHTARCVRTAALHAAAHAERRLCAVQCTNTLYCNVVERRRRVRGATARRWRGNSSTRWATSLAPRGLTCTAACSKLSACCAHVCTRRCD
jgi:hypothetical protein